MRKPPTSLFSVNTLQEPLPFNLSSLCLSLPESSVTKDSSSPPRSYHRNSLPPFRTNPPVTLAGFCQDRENLRLSTPPLNLPTRTPRKKTTLVRYLTSSLPPSPFLESPPRCHLLPSTPLPSSPSHHHHHRHPSFLTFPHRHPCL